MAYRLAGQSTEFCSCTAPCPCAFGQMPTGGRCRGLFSFDVQEGHLDGLSLAGTKFVLAATFGQVWTAGNFTAALILDANASQQQRDALTRIMTGKLGGDAATLAGLIGDMKGVFTAPIDYRVSDGQISVRAGDVAEGAGATLKNVDGSAEIQITNAHYPIPNIKAGRSTKTKVKVPGLEWDLNGSGMWTGPFVLQG